MRRGSGMVTAAVVLFSMAAVGCHVDPDIPLPERPAPEELPTAPAPQEEVPSELPSPPPDQPPPPPPPPPPVSECAGLPVGTPGEPSGWTTELLPMDYSCGQATSDGLGNLIVLAHHDFFGHETLATVLTPEGTPLNTYKGHRFRPFGQRSGFIGSNTLSYSPHWLTALSHTGALIKETPPDAGDSPWQVEDPTGGLVLFARGALTAYDATGNIRWSTPVPLGGSLRTIGVDRQGHTLVLADGDSRFGAGTLEGHWIDHSGQLSAPFFALQKPAGNVALVLSPQVGSGLFLTTRHFVSGKRKGSWTAAFASLQPASSAPPEWLTNRPDTTLHMAHGGKGYAVLPVLNESTEGCNIDIEVVSPSGESCGKVHFPLTSAACNRNGLWVGYDGTVIQSAPGTCDEVGHCSCSWKWWPGFFR